MPSAPTYRLIRPPTPAAVVPELDDAQRRVVEHRDGPLLVLAGPGTGKTTTLVEAVAARVGEGLSPDEVLVLTFGRKAADELRERIALRLGRTVVQPAAFTFHGFCLSVLRAQCAATGSPLPRLLSGAEREVRIGELLAGNAAGEGITRWPADLMPALRLRGFAREVSDLIDRARERGLDGVELSRLGERHDRPAWVAAGNFLEEYLDVLAARGEVDYAGLVATATALLEGPQAPLAARLRAVYVDEYQDTDPAQERLLRLLAPGKLAVAVGDPDQSIYGFRGAEVENILQFPRRFGGSGGDAPVVSLGTCRRMGPELVAASREFARRIPMGRLTAERDRHRALEPAGPVDGVAPVVRLFATGAEEAVAIADLLRRAHLVEGVAWEQMAVLVRSGVRSIPVLRRALVAAGIPVAVAADEIALGRDPALAPMLAALRVAAHGPDSLTPDVAHALLLSPLAGGTPSQLRALGRRLRDAERAAGVASPRPSGELLQLALSEPRRLDDIDGWIAEPARRLATLLADARAAALADATPAEVLWKLWDRSPWPGRLTAALAGGGAQARAADRDLDAVLALFDAANRLEDRRPHAGVSALLEEIPSQEIPAGPLEERGAEPGTVRLLTAHRSKGLEWDLVVVAAVQEDIWPDVRRRGTLLDGDAISPTGVRPEPSSALLLAEERRLFYVALTRARRRLVVTAVSGVDDEAERPSRFIHELDIAVPEQAEPPGIELLSPGSVVARLRRVVQTPDADPAERRAATEQLAVLATATDEDGVALAPAAHPDNWWGLAARTTGPRPIRPTGEPIKLSGSALSSFQTCPRRWFLDREVKAAGPDNSSQGFGSVVHALAEAVATRQLPADTEALMRRLDTVWEALPFDSPWVRVREHGEARKLVDRFLRWHTENDRQVLGAEVGFEVQVAPDVVVRGRADRLELDAEGRLVVVDLKTGKNRPNDKDMGTEPQLGVYQLAVRNGGFAEVAAAAPGGAELVQLRHEKNGGAKVQRQDPLPPDGDTWADELVDTMRAALRDEEFPARPNKHCGGCDFRTSCPAVDGGEQVIR